MRQTQQGHAPNSGHERVGEKQYAEDEKSGNIHRATPQGVQPVSGQGAGENGRHDGAGSQNAEQGAGQAHPRFKKERERRHGRIEGQHHQELTHADQDEILTPKRFFRGHDFFSNQVFCMPLRLRPKKEKPRRNDFPSKFSGKFRHLKKKSDLYVCKEAFS